MIADNNARRRNLVTISFLIIFYNLSGAHIPEDQPLRFPLTNLEITHGETALIVTAWALFALFWVLFRIDLPSVINQFIYDCHPGSAQKFRIHGDTIHPDHRFYKTIRSILIDKTKKHYTGDNPLELGDNSEIRSLRVLPGESLRDLLGPWTISGSVRYSDENQRTEHEAVTFPITKAKTKLRIIWSFIIHRPAFAEITAPQLVAGFAVLSSVWIHLHPLWILTPLPYLIFKLFPE